MRAWLDDRSTQEKIILVVGASVVFGAAYFLFLLEPLMQSNERLALRVQAERRLHTHLTEVNREVQSVGAPGQMTIPSPVAPGALVSVVTATAQTAGIQPYTRRMTPLGPDALSVFFEAAPFTDLTTWLLRLRNDHGIDVEQAAISANAVAGLVDAQLSLRNRGAALPPRPQ